MTDNNVRYSHALEHLSGDFAGIRAFLLKMHILRRNLDPAASRRRNRSLNINKRHCADYFISASFDQRFKLFDKRRSFSRSLVHFPVSRNN